MTGFRKRVARSRLAPIAALPTRLSVVGRHEAAGLRQSARWIVKSREHTNFTYDLTERNRAHLAWWVSGITGAPVAQIRGFMSELVDDDALRRHVQDATWGSVNRGLADVDVRLGQHVGWYALVRALKPQHVIETGTEKGLGSVVLAAALLNNGRGRLTTIDTNPDSGYLISGRYSKPVDRVIGDSVSALRSNSTPVDIFLHDSLHTLEHELAELAAVDSRLSAHGLALSDNAHGTDALMQWAERTGRHFSFFREHPAHHWYPGGGIGAAWRLPHPGAVTQ